MSGANYHGVQHLIIQGTMQMLGPSSPTKTQENQRLANKGLDIIAIPKQIPVLQIYLHT